MKRYFLVFYKAAITNGYQEGSVNIKTTGEYVNFDNAIKWILNDDKLRLTAVITNIIELSKSDFSDFISKEPPPPQNQPEH